LANISEQSGIGEGTLRAWQIIENGNKLLCSDADRNRKKNIIVIYAYDPKAKKWTKIPAFDHSLYCINYATLSPENMLYITGLETSTHDSNVAVNEAVQIWDYKTLKCISVFSPMPIKWDGFSTNQTYPPAIRCVLPLSNKSILLGCANGLQVFIKTEQSWYDSLWSYPWKYSFSFMQNQEQCLQCGIAPDGSLLIVQKNRLHPLSRSTMRILDCAHYPREASLWKTAQQFHDSQDFDNARAQGVLTRFNNLPTEVQERVYGELCRMQFGVSHRDFGRQLFHYEAVPTGKLRVRTGVPISCKERGQAIYNSLPIMKYALRDIAYGFKRHSSTESATFGFLAMQFKQLPDATKRMIYGEMYTLLKNKLSQEQKMHPRAGEFAFLNQNGFTATNQERAQAIENYLTKQKPAAAPVASTATAAAGTAPPTSGGASDKKEK